MKAKVLNFNVCDSTGDMFRKGQVRFSNPVKVIKDFNHSELLFTVELEESDEGLYAEFPDDESIKGLYPAIGYQTVKEMTHFELFAIGLCVSVNLDPTINPL